MYYKLGTLYFTFMKYDSQINWKDLTTKVGVVEVRYSVSGMHPLQCSWNLGFKERVNKTLESHADMMGIGNIIVATTCCWLFTRATLC